MRKLVIASAGVVLMLLIMMLVWSNIVPSARASAWCSSSTTLHDSTAEAASSPRCYWFNVPPDSNFLRIELEPSHGVFDLYHNESIVNFLSNWDKINVSEIDGKVTYAFLEPSPGRHTIAVAPKAGQSGYFRLSATTIGAASTAISQPSSQCFDTPEGRVCQHAAPMIIAGAGGNVELGSEFGDRIIFPIEIGHPGRVEVSVTWQGSASRLALILNGPGQVGYYARNDGSSPLTLSYDITADEFRQGRKWLVSLVNFGGGQATGDIEISYPAETVRENIDTQVGLVDYIGRWVNVDPDTRGLTKINIDQMGNGLSVHSWGACVPTDCDHGATTVNFSENPVMVERVFSFKREILTLWLLSNGELRVLSDNVFTDGTDRDYVSEYRFRRPNAYLYSTDTSVANSYKAFMDLNGYPTALIPMSDVAITDFSPYELILVGSDTSFGYEWGDSVSVNAIRDAGKPIMGLGFGGAGIFQALGLSTNWGNAWVDTAGSDKSIYVNDPGHIIFSSPNSVAVPTDNIVQLYTFSGHIGEYAPSLSDEVILLGRESGDANHYPLVQEDSYLLWGFSASPDNMTETGKDLFLNVVNYLTAADVHSVSDIVLDPPSPAELDFGQRVSFTFNYSTIEAGGIQIWARPIADGVPAPNYSAHGSPVYPVGEGGGSGYFTISSGEVSVDQIRFQMWTADNSKLLYESFVSVNYHFTDNTANLTAPTQLSPADGTVFNNFPRTTTLQWSTVPGIVKYTVEIDCFHCCESGKWCADVGETWRLIPNVNATNYTFDFVGKQPGRWRVWAVGVDGTEGPKSGWWGFRYTR